MEFIENAIRQRQAFPTLIGPREVPQVHQFGRPVNAVWLTPRGRIGAFLQISEPVKIFRATGDDAGKRSVISPGIAVHGDDRLVGTLQVKFESLVGGCPNREAPISAALWSGAQRSGARTGMLIHVAAAFITPPARFLWE